MGRARHLEHHTGYVRRHGRHVLVVVRNLYFIYDCTTFFTRYIGIHYSALLFLRF